MKKNVVLTGALACLLTFSYTPATAAEVDWSKVKGKTIKVFYPGVASWEFLESKDHGKGGLVVKAGDEPCASCHVSKEGKYDIASDNIIAGKQKMVASGAPLEPDPLSGRQGFAEVEVRAAYDAENIYLKFQWGGSGISFKDASLAKKGQADGIAVQLNDNMKVFRYYGCYIACHNDLKGMPKDSKKDATLYGFYTRGKDASDIKPKDKLDGYMSKGQFIDLWEVFFEGNKIMAEDEHILQARSEDKNDISATGGYEGGKYTVVIKRKLSTGDTNDIVIKDGKTFSMGIALYDNKMGGRRHYTSFPFSIGLSAEADISAQKF